MHNAIKPFFTGTAKWVTIGALLVTFLLGYFVGREHLKYQLRSGLSEAVSAIREGLGGGAQQEQSPAFMEKKAEEEPVTAKLLSKRQREARYIDGIEPAMEYSVELTNKTGKDIRAFTGILRFDDLFEREIQKVNVTYEDGLKVGETRTWDMEVKYNQFMDSDKRMASIDFADIKADLYVEEVIFTDGTKQAY